MAYDRADWHYGGDFPDGLPHENGATHIGFFIAWAIFRGLEGELHREDSLVELAAVRNRELTGREFFLRMCDAKFWDEDLNEEGNAFASSYYEDAYFGDYADLFVEDHETLYHVEDNWENFDRVADVIDRKYTDWKKSRSK